MAICAELLKEKKQNGCKTPGGVSNTFYLGQVENIDTYTVDPTTGAILTLVMKTGTYLKKFVGRARGQNTSGTEVANGEGGKVYTQTVAMQHDWTTQVERDALEQAIEAEGIFCINQTGRGIYEASGLPKNPAKLEVYPGLFDSTGSFQNGTAATDSNAATVTLSGVMPNGQVQFLNSLAAAKTYLDGLLEPEV